MWGYALSLDDHEWLAEIGEDFDPDKAEEAAVLRARTNKWRWLTAEEANDLRRPEAAVSSRAAAIHALESRLAGSYGARTAGALARALEPRLAELLRATQYRIGAVWVNGFENDTNDTIVLVGFG